MADTFTENYSFEKPEVGSARQTWGTVLNNTLDLIDAQFKTQEGDINLRLNLDGSVPMQGSITFANDDKGIVLCGGSRVIDDIDATSGVKTMYFDCTNNHAVFRTADGTSSMLDISLDQLTYKGEKVLVPSDAGTFFLPLTGGTLTGTLTVPILNVDKVGHNDNLWVDYVAGNGNAVQQFSPTLTYAGDRQGNTHNWVVRPADGGDGKTQMVGMTLADGGILSLAGGINQSSDRALKDNITPISDGLDLLARLAPVSYNFKTGGRFSYGFIAQDVASTDFAHAVCQGPGGSTNRTLNYIEFIAPLVAAVQELAAKVAALEAKQAS